MNAYSVFDAAVKAFNTPMFFQTDTAASRVFMMEIRRADAGNTLNANPGDFELYRIGEFDMDSGVFKAEASPQLVLAGRNVGFDQQAAA